MDSNLETISSIQLFLYEWPWSWCYVTATEKELRDHPELSASYSISCENLPSDSTAIMGGFFSCYYEKLKKSMLWPKMNLSSFRCSVRLYWQEWLRHLVSRIFSSLQKMLSPLGRVFPLQLPLLGNILLVDPDEDGAKLSHHRQDLHFTCLSVHSSPKHF